MTPLMCDADQHYYEPDDAFTRYLPGHLVDEGRAVQVVRSEDDQYGRVCFGDLRIPFMAVNLCDATGRPGALLEYFRAKDSGGDALLSQGMISADDLPESRHSDVRRQFLAANDVAATLMFPTLAIGVEYTVEKLDLPALTATLTAFNRWLDDDWGFGADGPIHGVPLLNLADLDWAIGELDYLIDHGARVVHLRPGPVAGSRSPADPVHDPFWARCQEAGVAVSFHLADTGEMDTYSSQWGENGQRPAHRMTPFQRVTSAGDRAVADTMLALVTHNLFGRFPDLTVMSVEYGCEWVQPLLKKMDRAARMCASRDWPYGEVTERPREVFKRHVKVVPYPEDNIVGLVDLIGAEAVLAGSDWPHPEGEVAPFDFVSRLEGHLTDEQLTRVAHDNLDEILRGPR